MKNKLGIASLVVSFLPVLVFYLAWQTDLAIYRYVGWLGYIFVIAPICAVILSMVAFFVETESKTYPMIALIFSLVFFVLFIFIIMSLPQYFSVHL